MHHCTPPRCLNVCVSTYLSTCVCTRAVACALLLRFLQSHTTHHTVAHTSPTRTSHRRVPSALALARRCNRKPKTLTLCVCCQAHKGWSDSAALCGCKDFLDLSCCFVSGVQRTWPRPIVQPQACLSRRLCTPRPQTQSQCMHFPPKEQSHSWSLQHTRAATEFLDSSLTRTNRPGVSYCLPPSRGTLWRVQQARPSATSPLQKPKITKSLSVPTFALHQLRQKRSTRTVPEPRIR